MKFGSYTFKVQLPFVFVSPHPILHELSVDICTGLQGEIFPKNMLVFVFCGGHKKFIGSSWLPGKKLVLQTEQLLDDDGKILWGAKKPGVIRNIRENIFSCDIFLDINENNRNFYGTLKLPYTEESKIFFGPHIFPKRPVLLAEAENNYLCFFGNVNGRRNAILKTYYQKTGREIRVVPEKTYGRDLKKIIKKSSGILNIHYEESTYTEAPRLLAAYLLGKPIVSEKLGSPFEKNVHYIGLCDSAGGDFGYAFQNFSELVSSKLSFIDFVNEHIFQSRNISVYEDE